MSGPPPPKNVEQNILRYVDCLKFCSLLVLIAQFNNNKRPPHNTSTTHNNNQNELPLPYPWRLSPLIHPEDEKDAHNSIRASTPGQVIDLPKPPDHIIVNINPINGIKWLHHLNLSPNSNLIRIPIGLTSRCKKKVRVGTQESVTYYAHVVDLAFARTVWKCQGGTFDYIIALLEQTPGSSTLTFEKLYVMFTRVKKACKF